MEKQQPTTNSQLPILESRLLDFHPSGLPIVGFVG